MLVFGYHPRFRFFSWARSKANRTGFLQYKVTSSYFMSTSDIVISLLIDVLHCQDRGGEFSVETPLLGAIPEFDSMVVVSIITALEDRFGIAVDDDEIDASVFETVGTLVAFVEQKLA